jgi:predicted CopG family antitoxin
MSTHTVALDGEAYAALKAMKRHEESFSDVVKRLAKPRRSILEFAGAWKDIPEDDWKVLRESYRRTRDADRRRVERLQAMWDRQ